MGYYKYLNKLWKKPKENFGRKLWQEKLIALRSQPGILRLEHPTRPDRARSVGYKAKQGFLVVRSRVTKGARKRPEATGGRRAKRYGHFSTIRHSAQVRAEEHAQRKYPNCEVLNSYWVGEDGQHKWFEVILVDRAHPSILADKNIAWIAKPVHKGRVFRGLTAAGRESRGLTHKGSRGVNSRPSKQSHRIK